MYGAILGDMIGAPYEFDRGNKTKDFEMFNDRVCFTDDSVMTIAVADALMRISNDADDDDVKTAVIQSMQKWGKKYPRIAASWRENWANLSTYFKFPQEVRRLIYTTNAIEGFNRQLRKVTKAKAVFPTDDSLLKMLYLAMMDITKKWTGRRQDWRSLLRIFCKEGLSVIE